MDVRQFALLVRQPSATSLPREQFCGMPKRGLAFLLANVMFWQPLWAQADGIAVSGPGTSLGQAGNGVPIVNIAAPNASGLSHNQFRDYNVGAEGLILNNATQRTQSTQLGAIILGNPNLGGRAASTILNEVNGGSPSQLRGYTEVAGQSARVIVANPYGITCSGCGFINTPRVTLTTGKPVLDGASALDHYQVDGGNVTIDGVGLNANNIDRFEIITRSTRLKADLQANNLAIIAGRNDVNAETLAATPRANDGSAPPQLAIDSSVLGGMYAGAIKLVGTEAGIGVRLAGNLAASTGDIQLDANGHLTLAQAASAKAINIQAASLDAQGPVYASTSLTVQTQGALNNQQSLAARDRINLSSAGQLSNNGIIEAGVNADNTRNATGDVSLNGQNLRNAGSVVASRNLDLTSSQSMDNRGGTLSGQSRIQVNATTLDNRHQGRLLSSDNLTLSASQVLNNQGLINSHGALVAQLGYLDNSAGEFSSHAAAYLTVAALDNIAGLLMAGQNLNLLASGAVNNRNGRLGASQALSFTGNTLNNSQDGLVSAGSTLKLDLASLDNRNGGLVSSAQTLSLTVGNVDNRSGELSSAAALSLDGQQLNNSDGGKLFAGSDLSLRVRQVISQSQGLISAKGQTTITGHQLDNSGGTLNALSGLNIQLDGVLSNLDGLINSEDTLTVGAASLNNRQGRLSSAGLLSLNSRGVIDNLGGNLETDAGLDVRSASLDNRHSGKISSKGPLHLTTGAFDNSRGGRLTSTDTLNLTATHVTNQEQGHIASGQALTANVTNLDQRGGQLFSTSSVSLNLNRGRLNNQNGLITAPLLQLHNLGDINNQGGEISSAHAFMLVAESLNNDNGKLLSDQALTLRINQVLRNIKGLIGAAALDVQASSLDNSGGELTSGGDLKLGVSGLLDNQGQGLIKAAQKLTINSASLNNQNGKILGNAIALDFGMATGDLNNKAGLITSDGQLSIQHLRDLHNQDGEISSLQSFSLSGRHLDNQSGKLISHQQLKINAGRVNNQSGLISGQQRLQVSADDLDNRGHGEVSSLNGDLRLDVSGSVLNSTGGALVTQKQLSLNVGDLDNSQGGIISSGGSQSLSVAGLFNNGQGGSIESGMALTLKAATLDNRQGTLIGKGAVSLTLLQALINSSGKLTSAGLLQLAAQQVDNQGGELVSNGLLTLLAGRLDNRNRGTVTAHDRLVIEASGAVENGAEGLIYSRQGDLRLRAASLNNQQGTLQSQGPLKLKVSGDIDNQRGRLLALDGELNLDAASLNNQGGRITAQAGHMQLSTARLDNRSGKIAGQQIDLRLAGAFDNASGVVESAGTLNLSAASVNNQQGQLRALGTDGATVFQVGGLFDNRHGEVESSNSDIRFTLGGLLNTDGTLLHVGGGTFDIATSNVINAGGSLVTQGSLTLTADDWTNSSIIQAAWLNLNVKHFTQTVMGQLLATNSLTGRGVSWSNDGLIASDGSLDLGLSGVYSGNGHLRSRGGLALSAGQLDLAESASITSEGDSLINVAGLFSNRGRLTSAIDLTLDAGSVNNVGTLGSGQDLWLTTSDLLNDHGLIFSGQDMGLRVNSLTNSDASIYSLGDLTIDRDGIGGWATSLVNRSGLIQSDGNLSLAASTLLNIRGLLTVSKDGIYAARIKQLRCIAGVNAGDCRGKRNRIWEITQRDKLEVAAASAASSITAGGNLTINGGDLLNASSHIATAGNLTATLQNLRNIGVEPADSEIRRVFITRRSRGDSWSSAARDFTHRYWLESSGYDAENLGGLTAAMSRFIGTTEAELTQFGRSTQLTSGDQRYAAIIQAAGAVNISTENDFDISVVRGGFDYVGSGPRTDTTTPQTAFSSRISLNQQLPPDLAQQQVNPLALPDFELPSGQNGLFRLSGQGKAQVESGTTRWSLSEVSIDSSHRQPELSGNSLSGNSGRDLNSGVPAIPDLAGPAGVAKVQGLPSTQGPSNAHKYLIETNPVLTDLKQFTSSDYLLGKLGYNPDHSAKRLGDGFYEQSLIQRAVVARTGQRFLAGLTSDEDMFRYLMDNALAGKESLLLSLGVSLSAGQVAALTHDIVWMETARVNGQEVLVPVLYLAQADKRLAANGALIMGRDVSLIAGKDLRNAGTLKASNNLTAMAGGNLINSGLVQAGNRLDLLAGNHLSNKAGGVIAGRDVSLTSLTGDILNERTVTGHASSNGFNSQHRDFIDNAARIEAANALIAEAGRDFNTIGGVLQSGRDTRIGAGRDVTLGTATAINSDSHGRKKTQRDEVADVKSVGSEINTGGDLTLVSAGDQRYQGAHLQSARDLTLDSGGSITFEAVKDLHQESHEKSNSNLAWQSAKGKGHTDETLRQSVLLAEGQRVIKAVDGLHIDLKQIDQKSLSEAIDAMVQADSNLAWLKEAEQRGDVNWRMVKELHNNWDYKSSGLGAAPSLITAIVASIYFGPLYGAMASNFAVGTINGGGDLGAGFSATTSRDALKGYATQLATAYAIGYVDSYTKGWQAEGGMILNGNGVNNHGYSANMLDWNTVAGNGLESGAHALVSGSIDTAINGGSWKNNLGNAAISEGLDLTAAFGNKQVGDLADYLKIDPQSASKILMHAILGGALAAAKGGDFTAGALAGAATEGLAQAGSDALGQYLDGRFASDDQFKIATAQIVGVLAGSLGGGDAATASWVAGNAERYNRQLHTEEKVLARKLAQQSDGKYSVEEIENQLRLSYKKGTEINPATDMVAHTDGIYDPDGKWVALGGGSWVQNFDAANKEIIEYIKQSTDAYSWTSEAETGFSSFPQVDVSLYSQGGTGERDRLTGYPLDQNSGYRVPVVVEGIFYTPRFMSCGNAECIATGANIDFGDANTLRWIRAANAKMIGDVSLLMGVGSVIATGGAAGVLSNGSTLASMLSGYLKDDTPRAIASYALSAGFERYAVSKGVSAGDASKASNALGAAGVWDTLVDNASTIF